MDSKLLHVVWKNPTRFQNEELTESVVSESQLHTLPEHRELGKCCETPDESGIESLSSRGQEANDSSRIRVVEETVESDQKTSENRFREIGTFGPLDQSSFKRLSVSSGYVSPNLMANRSQPDDSRSELTISSFFGGSEIGYLEEEASRLQSTEGFGPKLAEKELEVRGDRNSSGSEVMFGNTRETYFEKTSQRKPDTLSGRLSGEKFAQLFDQRQLRDRIAKRSEQVLEEINMQHVKSAWDKETEKSDSSQNEKGSVNNPKLMGVDQITLAALSQCFQSGPNRVLNENPIQSSEEETGHCEKLKAEITVLEAQKQTLERSVRRLQEQYEDIWRRNSAVQLPTPKVAENQDVVEKDELIKKQMLDNNSAYSAIFGGQEYMDSFMTTVFCLTKFYVHCKFMEFELCLEPSALIEHASSYGRKSDNKTIQASDIAGLREEAFIMKLKHETTQATLFTMNEKLMLISTELEADKEFYQRQIAQLEQELAQSSAVLKKVREENGDLQKSLLSTKNELKDCEEVLRKTRLNYEEAGRKEQDEQKTMLNRLEQENSVLHTSYQKDKEDVSRREDAYRAEILFLQLELNKINADSQRLYEKFQETQRAKDELENNLNVKYREQVDRRMEAEAEIRNLQLEKEVTCFQLQTQILSAQQNAVDALQNEYEQRLKIVNKRHAKEMDELNGQLQEARNSVGYLNETVSCLQEQLHHRKQYLQEIVPLSNSFTQTLPAELSPVRTQEERIKQLEDQLKRAELERDQALKESKKQTPMVQGENTPIIDQELDKPKLLTAEETRRNFAKVKHLRRLICRAEAELSYLFQLLENTILTVVRANNKECKKITDLLQLQDYRVQIPMPVFPRHLELTDVGRTNLIDTFEELQEKIIEQWQGKLAESAGNLSACCTTVCKVMLEQRERECRQAENLNELRHLVTRQLGLMQEQVNQQRRRKEMARSRQRLTKNHTVDDLRPSPLLSPTPASKLDNRAEMSQAQESRNSLATCFSDVPYSK
ncbi:unnamed protein product [Calicophoron daubneyi]|uniref:Uncharacterized protein n=1 Tax=Calicophoron daubneyi TaxID=300641 RepID=A0AAV2TFP6_CALDB